MARRKISQTEAWSLYHKVIALEKILNGQRNSWNSDWPSGTNIVNRIYNNDDKLITAISTARLLGHAVVVTQVNTNELRFYALPLGK